MIRTRAFPQSARRRTPTRLRPAFASTAFFHLAGIETFHVASLGRTTQLGALTSHHSLQSLSAFSRLRLRRELHAAASRLEPDDPRRSPLPGGDGAPRADGPRARAARRRRGEPPAGPSAPGWVRRSAGWRRSGSPSTRRCAPDAVEHMDEEGYPGEGQARHRARPAHDERGERVLPALLRADRADAPADRGAPRPPCAGAGAGERVGGLRDRARLARGAARPARRCHGLGHRAPLRRTGAAQGGGASAQPSRSATSTR